MYIVTRSISSFVNNSPQYVTKCVDLREKYDFAREVLLCNKQYILYIVYKIVSS